MARCQHRRHGRSPRVLGGLFAVALSMSVVAGRAVAQAPSSWWAAAVSEPPLVLDRVNVVDVQTGQVHAAQRVVIVGSRIRAIGRADKVALPHDARVVDARGQYLIPGLWDMHAHNVFNVRVTRNAYASYLVTGVTGVRDMLSPFPRDSFRQWWQDVLAGRRVSPRIVVAGYLKGGGRLPAVPIERGGLAGAGQVGVGTPQEGRQAVDSFYRAGVDFIKVHDESLPRDIYFAIAAEARRRGIPLAGHLPTLTVSMAEASDSGQRSFEHIPMWTTVPCWRTGAAADSACAALAARLRRNHSWLTPTMYNALENFGDSTRALFTNWSRPRGWYTTFVPDAAGGDATMSALWCLDRLHRFGFPLLAGTDVAMPDMENLRLDTKRIWEKFSDSATTADLVVVPGLRAPIHIELSLMVEAGLTPLEALRTATLNPATYFGATDSLGTVAPGKLADLVLLDANPLADIANLAAIRAVIANGRYFDRAALDVLVAEAKERIVAWASLERQARKAQEREAQTGQP